MFRQGNSTVVGSFFNEIFLTEVFDELCVEGTAVNNGRRIT
jgi:hypothetical protein